MIEGFTRLADLPDEEMHRSLMKGQLEMSLGPFSMRLQATDKTLPVFLADVYRDAPVRTELGDVTDVSINVRAPNFFRKYFRPQVIPDPGFIVPAVPLPPRLSPLAFEMGLNLSVALRCCRFTTFHSAVVANEKGAILISAQSGGGKSTLASVLMNEGYRLFSDEFGLLDMKEACLWPYPRPVSLKGTSIDIVRERTGEDWVTDKLSGTPKGDIAYRRVRPSDVAAADTPARCKLILFPVFTEGASPRAKELPKAEALMRLIPSSTNYHLLGEPAFESLIKMVEGARAYQIVYGRTEESLVMARDLAAGAGL